MEIREARALVAHVEAELRAFIDWWRPRAIWSSMFQLPELASITEKPPVITVEALTGRHALAQAEAALLQLAYVPNQHPGTALRFPGLVALTEDPLPRVAPVNAAKAAMHAALQAALQDETNAMRRARFYKELLPGVSILQATRQVNALGEAPYSFAFTWLSKSMSSEVLSPEKAVALVEAAKGTPPKGTPRESWEALLASQKARILALPPTVRIQRRRDVAPHPRLLALKAKGELPPLTFSAALPAFFPLPSGRLQDLPLVTPLQDFDRTRERKSRRARNPAQRHELVAELNLFYLDREAGT